MNLRGLLAAQVVLGHRSMTPTRLAVRVPSAAPTRRRFPSLAVGPTSRPPRAIALTAAAPQGPSPSRAVARAASDVRASAATSGEARQRVVHEARRLLAVRAEAQGATAERHEERAEALLLRVLEQLREPVPQTPFAAPTTPTANLPRASAGAALPPALPKPLAPAARAAALVEQIETFTRAQRPGLALTLHASLGARVELQRLGPKTLAVRLIGKDGPPGPAVVRRARQALEARGLTVGDLVVR